MVIWHLPGRRGQTLILIGTVVAALIGYRGGGSEAAWVWGGVAFVALLTSGWLWATMESYTSGS